jgi:hypothetical protein
MAESERITVEELTEAAVRGVERALAARATEGGRKPIGDVTVGVIIGPPDGDTPRPPIGPPDPIVDGPDIFRLKTSIPLSREASGRLADKVSKDPELRYALAQSLRKDFAGTIAQLFELTPAQYEKIKAVARDRKASVDHLSRVLSEAFRTDTDLEFNLDISETGGPETVAAEKKPQETAKKGIDWEIKIETKCETDKNCSAGASLTIKF